MPQNPTTGFSRPVAARFAYAGGCLHQQES